MDGNFGMMAAIADILLQSHEDKIVLHPVLPSIWPEGSVKSLCAHGGFELAMQWKAGFLIKGAIRLKMGASTKVSCDGSSTEITLAPEVTKKL